MKTLTRQSFRAKLLIIVGTMALAFATLVATGILTAATVTRHLSLVQERYVPKIELGPRLHAQFELIRRGLQDAVAAQDADALLATRQLKNGFIAQLKAARGTLEPEAIVLAVETTEEYYSVAYSVSRRLIEGQTGEELVDEMAAMQNRYVRAAEQLTAATAFNHAELAASFAAASRAQDQATRLRLLVTVGCLLLVLVLSGWLSRGLLRSLEELAAGFERFGRGELDTPIDASSRDELGALARRANQMAQSLRRLMDERDRRDWLKAGYAGLVHELRGELTPEEVATRASSFLARYLDAPAAAIYFADSEGALRLLGHYAGSFPDSAPTQLCFRPGEGLVGQAALQDKLMLITDLPPNYLRVRSALGEGAPNALVLLPLMHFAKCTGVLELAAFKSWDASYTELLMTVREALSIAIEVARTHAAIRELLVETQRQAQRLSAQEDEVRAANEELSAQQQELRATNAELTAQTRELQHHRKVLEQKNAELNETRLGLERKAEELATVSTYKSQFLANMSHELRTPLNSMLLLSDLLAENESGNLTDKQVEYCKTVHGAGKDLLALINQVLDLAKVESGRQELQVAPLRLTELIEYAEHMFAPVARDKGLEFGTELGPDVPEVITTDRQRIEQVLANLLGNALKFTHQGKVTLRIGKPPPRQIFQRDDLRADASLAFVVEDTGIGIAPSDHERVFVPFEQVDGRSDRRYGGTGLGLTIARELVSRLGGELHLHSELGKGSTFTCFFPCELNAAAQGQAQPEAAAPRKPQPESVPPEPRTSEGDLLVIEDDGIFADSLADIIHEQGLQCRIARDGASGMRMAREKRPAGIILDVKLSDTDGFAVMEQLRADPETASIPIHIVSALEAAERGIALGAVGYLTKPATRRDLVRVIESLVPKSRTADCRILIVEDDVDMADSLVERLESESIPARGASSAREAIEALTKEHFSCMVLDLGLPDVDGLDFLSALQQQGASETPPIVVYTGRALSKAEAQKLEAYTEAIVLKGASGADRLVDEIRLFARRLRDGLPAKRLQMSELQSAHSIAMHGRKVLIADDDMRTVYALSALLRAKGLDVLVADTGQAALDALGDHPDVEVVLMDIMMPEMDGYEATRLIRCDERLKHLPVIALTAKAMVGDREKALEVGATDYLSKPIDADRLLAMIQRHLAERPQHAV